MPCRVRAHVPTVTVRLSREWLCCNRTYKLGFPIPLVSGAPSRARGHTCTALLSSPRRSPGLSIFLTRTLPRYTQISPPAVRPRGSEHSWAHTAAKSGGICPLLDSSFSVQCPQGPVLPRLNSAVSLILGALGALLGAQSSPQGPSLRLVTALSVQRSEGHCLPVLGRCPLWSGSCCSRSFRADPVDSDSRFPH